MKTISDERYTETVNATPYRKARKVVSKLVPRLVVHAEDDISCPRCNENLGALKHGQEERCSGCDLYVTLLGNSLRITDDPPQIWRDVQLR